MSRRYGSQVEGAPKTKLGEFESKNKVTLYQSIKKCPEVHTDKNKWLEKQKKKKREKTSLSFIRNPSNCWGYFPSRRLSLICVPGLIMG